MPPLIVISGASGSGKTTICRMVADKLHLSYAISHTTRPGRPGEKNGRDYFFVDQKTFDRMIAEKQFLEWAEVYGNLYGTSSHQVEDPLKQGRGVIVDVDIQGAKNLKSRFPKALLVFLSAPSKEHLKNRLQNRGTDSDEVRALRLREAEKEEEAKVFYDAVLVNEDVQETYKELEKLIRLRYDDPQC